MMHLCGWKDRPAEVERIVQNLEHKTANSFIKKFNLEKRTAGNEPTLLYKYFKDVTGFYAPCGPQKIGDCVSWGWGNVNNHIATLQIWSKLNKKGLIPLLDGAGGFIKDAQDHPEYRAGIELLEEYEETCTEWIYGGSRVEIGGQRGDMEDGSVGAWAAQFVAKYGTLSRKYLEKKGLSGAYDPQRAKNWGANGVPDNLEPDAKNHLIRDVVPVTGFEQARTMIRAYKPVAVCSDQGFTEQRDSKGRCRPSGTWNHCMSFVAEAENMLLCWQNWGPDGHPSGPIYLDQPPNTFWVEADVCDRMLKQNDSFAAADFMGYDVEDFLTWHH
jgi:hypothetical protein